MDKNAELRHQLAAIEAWACRVQEYAFHDTDCTIWQSRDSTCSCGYDHLVNGAYNAALDVVLAEARQEWAKTAGQYLQKQAGAYNDAGFCVVCRETVLDLVKDIETWCEEGE